MTEIKKEFYNDELEATDVYTEVKELRFVRVRDIDNLLVLHRYWKDSSGELWSDFDDPMENSKKDFIVYRTRKGYMTPESIKKLRENAGQTVREFSDYLGIGSSTLSQLENNLRVQTKETDALLQMVNKYYNLNGRLPSIGVKDLIDALNSSFKKSVVKESKYSYQDPVMYENNDSTYDNYSLRVNGEAA
ncbi:helix-turn-helix domain-containing protein [Levilactobacillus yiduensis]|uniref:helix-turn-helix domain-containing protein n=1 Tax=Levilactobacillus yiduensis TaxID=2953880 RepID=UPI000EF30718|nr:helix-turn-helix transcriptional regulator [Levilactobacillus yiduensis]AYM01875.1 XRE family transcriptional regulator [Levilactobacillus brevis]